MERRIMKKLFWPSDPLIRVPHIGEDWIVALKDRISASLQRAIAPLSTYLETLSVFTDLISIDVRQYAIDMESKYCPNADTMDLAGLCAVAKKHADDSESVFNMLPSHVSTGLVFIDCKVMKNLLSLKHKSIATKLFDVLERKTKEFAENVMADYRRIFDELSVTPRDIEGITDLREKIAGMPKQISEIADKNSKNDSHYELLEQAKWKIPLDQMDIRWDVFRWPGMLASEIAKQERNLRTLEYQFKADLGEEQSDYNQEINNIKGDIAKLKDLTQLSAAPKNALTVRNIRGNLNKADERAKLYNSREMLFGAPPTDYSELQDLNKKFEPFYDLWDCAEKWLTNVELWTNGPFLSLDSDSVENAVSVLLRNLAKSAKSFERLGLSQCNIIAAQVRDEVSEFRVRVPLIISLRNAGMRDRHWQDLADKTGAAIPEDKSTLTLQKLCDMGLLKAIADVEKVAEKASKEFAIEVALDKMAKAWEKRHAGD